MASIGSEKKFKKIIFFDPRTKPFGAGLHRINGILQGV
jgi:hypothetical protein